MVKFQGSAEIPPQGSHAGRGVIQMLFLICPDQAPWIWISHRFSLTNAKAGLHISLLTHHPSLLTHHPSPFPPFAQASLLKAIKPQKSPHRVLGYPVRSSPPPPPHNPRPHTTLISLHPSIFFHFLPSRLSLPPSYTTLDHHHHPSMCFFRSCRQGHLETRRPGGPP